MQKQTTMLKESEIVRKWYLIDASTLPLGRLITEVSKILTGKNKPTYTPYLDTGDNVVIINAANAVLTGDKLNTKEYKTQVSQRPGGLRVRKAKIMKEKYPVEMVEHAIKGMLPKGPLGSQMFRKVHVYAGLEHPHAGQNPEVLVIK